MPTSTRASKRRRLESPSLASTDAYPHADHSQSPADDCHQAAHSDGPLVVFAHGAGAGASSAFMISWKRLFETKCHATVYMFDFPHIAPTGRAARPPPRMPELVSVFQSAIANAVSCHARAAARGVFLAGKSMGGRVALYVAEAEQGGGPHICGCVMFGYPAGSPASSSANTEERRNLVRRSRVPIMFVHGTKDRVAPVATIISFVSQPSHPQHVNVGRAARYLHLVHDGDHSLTVTKTWLKANRKSQDDVNSEVVVAIERFLRNPSQATDSQAALDTGPT